MSPPHVMYPSERGSREQPGDSVLNLGDRAPVGVDASPHPRPLDNPQEKGPAFRVRYA